MPVIRCFLPALSTIFLLVVLLESPDAQVATFKFGAAGDFGTSERFEATANAVAASKVDFMIALGDLSYSSNSEEKWCKYWIERVRFPNLLIVPGNHDTKESRGGDLQDYLRHCGNPFQQLTKGIYPWQYYVDFPADSPTARFILVSPGIEDETYIKTNYSAGTPGFDFVANTIDDARAKGLKWIVVGMHKNYISAFVKRDEISLDRGKTFMSMLLNKRVDLILVQAHEHGYERTRQLATNPSTCPLLLVDTFNKECVVDSDDELVKGAGTVILVLGTGGKSMRSLEPSDSEYGYFVEKFSYKDKESFGFGEFTLSSTELLFRFVRSFGPSFNDSFRIKEEPSQN